MSNTSEDNHEKDSEKTAKKATVPAAKPFSKDKPAFPAKSLGQTKGFPKPGGTKFSSPRTQRSTRGR